MKQLISLAHYEMPAVQEKMGYRPQQWIETVTKRRLDLYDEDIQRHQASLLAPDPLIKRAGAPAPAAQASGPAPIQIRKQKPKKEVA
jgi:hypothetical protein